MGWELLVTILGLSHNAKSRDTGRQCRRGIEGRFLAGFSAGDVPFGYSSAWATDDWQELLQAGKRPVKKIIVNEEQAAVVREIFHWYADECLSMQDIANRLTKRRVGKSRRSKGCYSWTPTTVSIILANTKYIGKWTWGLTHVVRNGAGVKRSVKAPASTHVTSERPHLRIIDDDLFERVQARRLDVLSKLGKACSASTPMPPRHIYPKRCLSGLVRCPVCDARLHVFQIPGRPDAHLRCPKQKQGLCTFKRYLNAGKIQKAMFAYVAEICSQWPSWFDSVVKFAREAALESYRTESTRAGRTAIKLGEVDRQLKNLLDVAEAGCMDSKTIASRISVLEQERSVILQALKDTKLQAKREVSIPSDEKIRERLMDLPNLLMRSASPDVARVLRSLFTRVTVDTTNVAGRSGAMRLEVTIDPMLFLSTSLCVDLGKFKEQNDRTPKAFTTRLEFYRPPATDLWGPKVAEMRDRGRTWKQIGVETNLPVGPLQRAYYAYRKKNAA